MTAVVDVSKHGKGQTDMSYKAELQTLTLNKVCNTKSVLVKPIK